MDKSGHELITRAIDGTGARIEGKVPKEGEGPRYVDIATRFSGDSSRVLHRLGSAGLKISELSTDTAIPAPEAGPKLFLRGFDKSKRLLYFEDFNSTRPPYIDDEY